ncbi:MAG TPA: Ig-like domain-containing protein [Gemmatimonadales bacterium]|nr:Ig-like domain-containing protein [Gemmatimonadales bacterium]
MTFKHKLSRRLALLRNVFLLGLVATTACDLQKLIGLLTGVVVSVSVEPAAPSLVVGTTVQLAATPKDANGNPVSGRVVTWASSAPAVATVSGGGVVTGMAAGAATITATSEGQSGTAAATVTNAAVASVTVSPAAATATVGQTVLLTATPKDASGQPLSGRVVTWASSAPAVATVSGSGVVTGMAAGAATITATSEGQSGTAALTVTASVTNPGRVTTLAVAGVTDTSVTLSFTEVTDGTGQPASYIVRYAVGTIDWGTASEPARGTCTPPVVGSVIGAKRTCTVLGLAAATGYQFQLVAFRGTLNVNAVFGLLSNVASGTTAASMAPVAAVTVNPASASVGVGGTQPFTATLKDANGTPLTGRTVTWASSAPPVATVSASGLVTGVVAGTATITATSEGQSGTAALTVTASPPPPSGTWPNEPTGMTVRTDWGLDQVVPSGYPLDVPIPGSPPGWRVVYELAPGPTHGWAQLVADPSAPFSPASVYDFVYPQGMVEGNAPATVYYANLGVGEVYAGFWWKPSSPFDMGPNGNKIAFLFNGGGGAGGQQFMILMPDGRLHVLPEYPGDLRWRDPNVNATLVTLGAWHRIEWYCNLGTGALKWWLDGVLQGSYTDVRNSYNFDMFQFSPTWGGNSGAQKQETDHYWFDHVHLSVR